MENAVPPRASGRRAESADRPALRVYAVRAEMDPQVLLRIIGLFAQRSIIPQRVHCRASEASLSIDIEAVIEAPEAAERLLEKLRSTVLVDRVDLVAEKPA